MADLLSVGKSQFERDAILDPAIGFPHALTSRALTPCAILLTGTTGLVGTYLLDELLRKTQASVHCLVRAPDTASARQRIVGQLQAYGLWRDELQDRIVPIAGNVAQPRLGLSEEHFAHLAGEIDVIYHSAGVINMRHSYAQLKPTNVDGVQEALRLAGLKQTKPFHFVSSIAVFYSDAHPSDKVLNENDIPKYHATLKGNYGKSKWVADRLVACAQARGLPACIYRPTRIMGHSRTGVLNDTTEILPALLRACILLGLYPDWDIEITLVPVDYVSQAIVHLSTQPASWGKAFHFFNPAPIPWRDLMAILRSLGYPLQEIPFQQWQQEIKHRASRDSDETPAERKFFAGMVLAFMGLHYLFLKRPPFDGSNLREGLSGSGITCPAIDDTLIGAHVSYWQKSGFLPLPYKVIKERPARLEIPLS